MNLRLVNQVDGDLAEAMLTGMLTEGARSCTARRGLIPQRRRVWWP
jgi:hypothetical protein